MNKKTYWWRCLLLIIPTVILLILYSVPCGHKLARCFWGNNNLIRTTFHFFGSILVVSPFLFFIKDSIFLKWLRLALVWIVVSIFLIVLIPDQQPGLFSFGGPSKETLSIFFGSLFVIVSLAKIGWEWFRERKVGI